MEIFLNFPVADMNRNVLWRNPDAVATSQIERMNRFWGDDSWRTDVYSQSRQTDLFGNPGEETRDAEVLRDMEPEILRF